MKRLMIYSKHKMPNIKDIFKSLRENSSNILLFTLFLCGVIIGSCSATSIIDGIDINTFEQLFCLTAGKCFIYTVLFTFAFFILNICCAFSCFGCAFIAISPFIKGFFSAVYLSFAVIYFETAPLYIKFFLTYIPGFALGTAAFLLSSAKSMNLSTKIAADIFIGSRINLEIKSFVIFQIVLFVISIAGGALNLLLSKLLL